MNYTQLDLQPVRPGYGMIWQGGLTDMDIFHLPGPLVIVGMTGGKDDAGWLFHSRAWAARDTSGGKIQGALLVEIADIPSAVLPDEVYLGLVEACCGYLRNGVNLYIHCRMGLSRSTYLTAGIYMKLLDLPAEAAVKIVAGRRKNACPNWGFCDHLDALEGKLRP